MSKPAVCEQPGRGEPLPDYTGLDLDDLRVRVVHPVLAAVLAGLARRSRDPRDAAAYHEDAPDLVDDD